MVQYMHKQCESAGWLDRHDSPDPSAIGVMMKVGNEELARQPPTLNSMVIAAFESIDASIAFTMSSNITASLFRQMSPYQTEIVLRPQGVKIPIVESLEQAVTLATANKIKGNACIIRNEKIVLVWTNSVDNLLPHGAEIEKLLVETVSYLQSLLHAYIRPVLPSLQMWRTYSTHTRYNSSAASPDPHHLYSQSPRDSVPSDVDRYVYREDEMNSNADLKSNVGVSVKTDDIYDPEVAIANAKNRPSKIHPSIPSTYTDFSQWF
jgi:hypothetical protein